METLRDLAAANSLSLEIALAFVLLRLHGRETRPKRTATGGGYIAPH